ncbi:ABC transporter ATP-binding protein [Actinoplanes sp. NPDC024001]|uniref:ABC transporter ATP-binding protein n=1 Tax=Actinoplanes sp. NPDC024001 TaxID=3154598 RepID=UPI0033FEAB36
MTRMPAVRFDRVQVRYGDVIALDDFSLEVAAGETVALLGPSGSGKSTALKALAGFVRPAAGRVFLDGRDVTGLPPYRRGLGVVVQQYALFPHMSVADNIAFGLRARRMRRDAAKARVEEMLRLVGLPGYGHRYPRELSGGQQQRVAIARALAIRPAVLLLDEPLSALDAQLRADLLDELRRLRDELPDVAMLYVTHDQTEALTLANRIAVMRDARMVDLDTAEGLYRQPPSRFTAAFLGGANLLPATVVESSGLVRVGAVTVTASSLEPLTSGDSVQIAVRPHTIAVSGDGDGIEAVLTGLQWRGSTYRLTCLVDGVTVHADMSSVDGLPAVGSPVRVRLPERGAAAVTR